METGWQAMVSQQKLELYIHIPFCVRKCRYCDFLSMPANEDTRRKYVDRLLEEIRQQGLACRGYQVVSVFVGGGTPSLLAGVQIWEIMEAVRSYFSLERDAEITIECNPGTLTAEKLSFYKSAGINRLSLGLQSADDRELRELGRIHTYREFLESFDLARKMGFDNVNVDLMSGLPGQKVQDWANTLKKVLALVPEHISAYSLIVEEGTPFFEAYGEDELRRQRGEEPYMLPTEEAEREMYDITLEMLKSRGYLRYEISNYALPCRECRHNIGYWQLTPYLGLGLGSSSFMGNARFSNKRQLSAYMNEDFCHLPEIMGNGESYQVMPESYTGEKLQAYCEQEKVDAAVCYLDKKQQMEEFMFLGLRMTEGISRERFQQKFHMTLESVYGAVLQRLQQQGFLEFHEGIVRLTEAGIGVSNYVFCEFIS